MPPAPRLLQELLRHAERDQSALLPLRGRGVETRRPLVAQDHVVDRYASVELASGVEVGYLADAVRRHVLVHIGERAAIAESAHALRQMEERTCAVAL